MGRVTRRSATGAPRIAARHAFHDEAGVSIIEALIAALVVGIGAVGAALMFGSGQAFISAEGDNRVATFLAQQQIERVRAYGYTGLVAICIPPTASCPFADPPVPVNGPGSGIGPCVPGEPCYRRTTIVACKPRDNYAAVSEICLPNSSAFVINVTVESVGDPKTRTVSLSSVLAPR
jgi:type II secretory pathway pseudopilin PulG